MMRCVAFPHASSVLINICFALCGCCCRMMIFCRRRRRRRLGIPPYAPQIWNYASPIMLLIMLP